MCEKLLDDNSLRAPIPTKASGVFDSEYVDPKRKPFVSFKFKYRSRGMHAHLLYIYMLWLIVSIEALQSLLIIARTPSPVPLEERDVDSLSPHEMRDLLRRQRERDQAARAVKREHGVKRERERNRERSRTAVSGGEWDDYDDDVSFVSTKRKRLPVTLNEDGIETIDLT